MPSGKSLLTSRTVDLVLILTTALPSLETIWLKSGSSAAIAAGTAPAIIEAANMAETISFDRHERSILICCV